MAGFPSRPRSIAVLTGAGLIVLAELMWIAGPAAWLPAMGGAAGAGLARAVWHRQIGERLVPNGPETEDPT
jgi:hypothetical protein